MYQKIFILLSLFLLLISCDRDKEINNIGEIEYYFDEKLSSLSMDEDGSFWIGSETGDLFHFKDNYRKSFDLKEDRIYKIKREVTTANDTLFWIGIRNSGLQLWQKGECDFEKIKTYSINFKREQYSPYDFLIVGEQIYVATSQGVYSLDKKNKKEEDSLSLIYPSKAFLAKNDGTTFVVHNICSYKDSLLLASTQHGLLWYNIKEESVKLMLEGKVIEHVSIYDDTIYTITKGHLYLYALKGEELRDISVENVVKSYFQINGTHYLIGTDEVFLSNNLKDFYNLQLRRSIPMACRNLISADTLNNFTYLLTDNAIWRIPNNIEVFEGNNAIKASCGNDDYIYYLTQANELFVQKHNNKKAKWVYTFPEDDKIQKMDIVGNTLYYYNLDNDLKRKEISEKWLINYTLNSSQTILQSEAKITAANVTRQNSGNIKLYLGIQDGFITVGEHNKTDTVFELSKAYITSMFRHKDTDRLYIATLNNGVFYIGQDSRVKKVSEIENISFINDLIITNEHNPDLILLTNQKIISKRLNDSIRVKGYKKLIYVNDTLFYGLPEFGVHKFSLKDNKIVDRGILFKDIRFRETSFLSDGRLILVSNIGSLSVSVDNENNFYWVQFADVINVKRIQSMLLSVAIILILGYLVISFTKRRNANIVEIRKRKEDLSLRLDELVSYYDVLSENERSKITELKNRINSIEVSSKNKRDVGIKLKDFFQQTADLNRRAALLFPQKLNEQIEQIEETDSFEKTVLLESSRSVQKVNSIELIKEQIKINADWLKRREELLSALETSIERFGNCAEIDGVNKYLFNKLMLIRESLSHKPIEELSEEYSLLIAEINHVETDESSSLINAYIANLSNYLMRKIHLEDDYAFLQDSLELVKHFNTADDNVTKLKKLKSLDDQVKILKTLEEIGHFASKYREVYDQIIRDNNKQIKKKLDKELESYIEDNTESLVRQINAHIILLYDLLITTDYYVVKEVLKLNNTEGQHARVLALLISDFKIKRTLIPGMLGIYGNLNPVISRLINNRIKPNENILLEYQRNSSNQSVFVHLVLNLLR